MQPTEQSKACAACGRTFAWRRRWARCWHEVRYCSDRCRRHKPSALDQALEEKVMELLAQRERGATICPSEAARALAPDDWRALMERTRQAARRLVTAGRLQVLQRGVVVDASTARGPIRLRFRLP